MKCYCIQLSAIKMDIGSLCSLMMQSMPLTRWTEKFPWSMIDFSYFSRFLSLMTLLKSGWPASSSIYILTPSSSSLLLKLGKRLTQGSMEFIEGRCKMIFLALSNERWATVTQPNEFGGIPNWYVAIQDSIEVAIMFAIFAQIQTQQAYSTMNPK